MTTIETPSVARHKTEGRSTALSRWADANFGGLPRVFWVVFTGSALARLAFFVVPFLSYYLSFSRHLGSGSVAKVMLCFGIGWTAAGPIGGWLADRVGRRAPLVIGALGAATSYIGLAQSHQLAVIAAWALLAGLSFDMYRPSITAIIADRVPATRRQQAFTLWNAGIFNGMGAVSTLAGGILAQHRGFEILFIADAGFNVLFAASMLILVPRIAPRSKSPIPWQQVLSDRALVGFWILSAIAMVVWMQSMITLPVAFSQVGITPSGYGLISAANPAGAFVLQLAFQPLIGRYRIERVCATAVLLIGVGIAATGMGHTIAWFIATTAIWTLGEAIFAAVGYTIVEAMAPEKLKAVYAGVWQTHLGFALLIGPLFGGALATYGDTTLWLSCAGLGAVAAGGCLLMGRTLMRRRAVAVSV